MASHKAYKEVLIMAWQESTKDALAELLSPDDSVMLMAVPDRKAMFITLRLTSLVELCQGGPCDGDLLKEMQKVCPPPLAGCC